ncbi:MAG: 3-isopropylmalate dehydratase small subunit [Proteobacteria bacterium]|nr:3-isopropylmalate dehydratase small subunit [Pseudomonadota bacterium]NOG59047.1 3-isopropylmalate dehydratase small subunit [Pseudomonadota bacterium]
MEKFKTFTGIVAPLDRSNVDTDAIIPKQFLKSIKRSGFGPNLFDDWRYLDSANPLNEKQTRKVNPDFVLNQSPYDKAEVLLARENFGCGSSREHAVWAITDFGLKVVLAPSFGDIFYSNSFKNGFLPVRLKAEEIDSLFNSVESRKGFKVTVNLEEQYIETEDKEKFSFNIDAGLKERMLEGLDDIGLTLNHAAEIREYEQRRKKITPWLFKEVSA